MFTVPDDEWALAANYFRRKPHKTKFRKSRHGTKHSFVRLNVDEPEQTDSFFAISNKTNDKISLLGEGNAKVKRVKNQRGSQFALKIERNRPLRQDSDQSLIIMRALNFYKGQTLRRIKGYTKRYTLLELIEGEDLFELMDRNQTTPELSDLQIHLIALALCLCVHEFHSRDFIHGDLKPANFIIQLCENYIAVRLIDFDYSLSLASKGYATWKTPRGTDDYIAPETLEFCRYSPISDVFSLGVILGQLGLEDLSEKMTCSAPSNRLLLPHAISLLIHKIKTNFNNLDNDVLDSLNYALFATQAPIQEFLKTSPSLDTLYNLKICQNYLSPVQRYLIGLRCGQALLKVKGDISRKNIFVTLDSHHIDVSIKPEAVDQDFSEGDYLYFLDELLNNLGVAPSDRFQTEPASPFSLFQAMQYLTRQFSTICTEPFASSILAEIRAELQGRSVLNTSFSSTTSSGSSSLILDLPLTRLASPLSSPASTLSPHSINSTSPSFDSEMFALTEDFSVLHLSAASRAAEAAAPVDDASSPATSSFLPLRKLFDKFRNKEGSLLGKEEKKGKTRLLRR